jgi:hypothetical protein
MHNVQPKIILVEGIDIARALDKHHLRAEALTALAKALPEKDRLPLLREALQAAGIAEDSVRQRVLGALADQLVALPSGTLYELWQETIHILSARTRYNLFSDLIVLTPLIDRLCTKDVILEIAEAVYNVRSWWP